MQLSHRYSPQNLPIWGICVSNPYWSGKFKLWLIWGQGIFHVLLTLGNRNRELSLGTTSKLLNWKDDIKSLSLWAWRVFRSAHLLLLPCRLPEWLNQQLPGRTLRYVNNQEHARVGWASRCTSGREGRGSWNRARAICAGIQMESPSKEGSV